VPKDICLSSVCVLLTCSGTVLKALDTVVDNV
jgi:hypothetical protein